jgi:hypothetical protein
MRYDENDGNDGRFPGDSIVQVRFPRSEREEKGNRAGWPWLPAEIVQQCRLDEWLICVTDQRYTPGSATPASSSRCSAS